MNTPDSFENVVDDSGPAIRKPARLTVPALRGIVPALPGRETVDFEEQIEEAMEEEAARIVAEMQER